MPMMAEMQMQSKWTGKISVQVETGEMTQRGPAHETMHIRDNVGLDLNQAQVMDRVREEYPDLDMKRISKVRYQKVNKCEGVAWLGQAELERLNKRIAREEKKAAKEQKRAEKNAAAAAEVSETIEAISEELAPVEKIAPVAPAPAIDPGAMEEQPKKAGRQRSLLSAIGETFSTITHNMVDRSIDKMFPGAERQETPKAIEAPKEIRTPEKPAAREITAPAAQQPQPAKTEPAKTAPIPPRPQDIDPNVDLNDESLYKAYFDERNILCKDGVQWGYYWKRDHAKKLQADAEAAAKARGETAAPAAEPQTPQPPKPQTPQTTPQTPPSQAKPAEPAACTFAFGVNKAFDALIGKLIDGALAGSTVTLNCEQLLQAGADPGVLQSFHITPQTPLLVRKPSLREIADARAQNNNPPRKPGRSSGKKK